MNQPGWLADKEALEITLLADAPGALPLIAQWQYGEWGFLDSDDSVSARTTKLESHLNRNHLPLSLVAASGDEVIGSADLVAVELPEHADLGPWLSCVFVAPPFRHRGVGTQLTRAAEALAEELGHNQLYLCTWNRESFYKRLGWQRVRSFSAHGAEVAVMTKRLQP